MEKSCSFILLDGERCPRKYYCKGWCKSHYTRWKKTGGDPTLERHRPGEVPPCGDATCDRLAEVKGYCTMHYHRIQKHGTTDPDLRWARVTTLGERLLAKSVLRESGCREWLGKPTKFGYGKMGFQGETKPAHVWAYEHWIGEVPEGLDVLHKCDNKICIHSEHLETGTQKKNNNDAWIRGRQKSKLTREQIMEIREKWVAGKLTQKQLAEEYGVTQAVISNRIRYSILVDGPREKSPHGRPRLGGFFKSKLTREQVLEIRERYAAGGVMQKDLAAEYGVSSTTLHRCLRSYLIADDPRAEAAYTTFHRKRDGWKG